MMLQIASFLLASLLVTFPAMAQEKPAAPIKLSLPNATWHLEIPGWAVAVQRDVTRPDGNARSISGKHPSWDVNLSAFLERIPSSANASQCREHYWDKLRRSPVKREDVKLSERGEMAILEYAVRDLGGFMPEALSKVHQDFEQRHLNVYLSRDGVCIDVHLSKALKRGEGAPFGPIVEAIRLVDASRAGQGKSATQVTERVRASVVIVRAHKPTAPAETVAGTGFFVGQAGHIAVASHVVVGATNIEIVAWNGNRSGADFVAADKKTGLALIKIKTEMRLPPPLAFAAKDAQSEDRVYVVSGDGMATEASVASLLLPNLMHLRVPRQVDGPIITADGEVVGIVMAHVRPKEGTPPPNISLAVPSSTAARIAEQLGTKGKVERASLGLQLANLDADIWAEFGKPPPRGATPRDGVLIKKLDESGPAFATGLKAGDRILLLDGTPVRSGGEFLGRIEYSPPGAVVSLTLVRDGREQVLRIKLWVVPE